MKNKILLILGILAVIFVLFTVASIMYTQRPEFCLTCHIMKPYYDSWKKSAHNQENCIECHYAPGLKAHVLGKINGLVEVARYLTGKYPKKFSAEVDDLTCLRGGCHTREAVAAKKPAFKNKVVFNHEKHFASSRAGVKLNCTNCHNQLTSEEHIAIDENTCFTCHFKNREGEQLIGECLNCHAAIKETQTHKEYLQQPDTTCLICHSDAKKGGGEILKQLCYSCHADKVVVEKIGDAGAIHKIHTEKNRANCRDCHHIVEHN